jgi:hypothetical protein
MIQPSLYKEKDLIHRIQEKKYFMLAVFSNLVLQACIIYYYLLKNNNEIKKNKKIKKEESRNNFFLHLYLGCFLILLFFFISMPSWLKFILFCVLSHSIGNMLAYLPEINFIKSYIDTSLEVLSIESFIGLFLIFFLFFLLVCLTKIKLSYLYFLLYGGILLIALRMITLFDSTITTRIKFYTVAIFTVISLYMIYDSYNVLYRDYRGDFVSASFDYFSDSFLILNKNLERLIFL